MSGGNRRPDSHMYLTALCAAVRPKNLCLDSAIPTGYDELMTKTIEFETELAGCHALNIPPEIAATLFGGCRYVAYA